MHYLIGATIQETALGEMRLLSETNSVSGETLRELAEVVEEWLQGAGEMTNCLRVELCAFALREVERLGAYRGIEAQLDQLLERHYTSEPVGGTWEEADRERGAWRRACILELLEDHPEPFELVATVRLLGRLTADRIADLQWPSRGGALRRVARVYRRSRFRSRVRLWPQQLLPLFPFACLGHGARARAQLAELADHFPADTWSRLQAPEEAQLAAAHQRLRYTANPLGVLVAEALLGADPTADENLRRGRLQTIRDALVQAQDRAG
jgi:hypothetical protein